MSKLLMSDEYSCFCKEMKKQGYEIIPTENIDLFQLPERRHADMQALRIRDKLFTLQDCSKPIGRDYPENVRLNCLYLDNKLYGNLKAIGRLLEGQDAKHAAEILKGNDCGGRGTSCADQLSKALEEALA